MFCRNCGKELNDEVNYCPYCGHTQSGTKRINLNVRQIDFLWLITILLTVYVAVGGLVRPICSIGIWGDKEYSIADLLDTYDIFDNLTDRDMGIDDVFMFFINIFSVGAAIVGIIFLVLLFKGERDVKLYQYATITTYLGLITVGLIFVWGQCINGMAGFKVFSLTIEGWVLLIASLINRFVFIKRCEARVDTRMMVDKVCLKCKTMYSIGNKCPQCGYEAKDNK